MSFISKNPFRRTHSVESVSDETEKPEDIESRKIAEKAKQDEEIKKNLSDPKFLNFLQKNPDAVSNANNDEYIQEKVLVFNDLQGIKKEVKKFVVLESGKVFADIVEGDFMDKLEDVAIKEPERIQEFSARILQYLGAVERNRTLEDVYRRNAEQLGIDIDYDKLTATDKVEYIKNVQVKFEEFSNSIEGKLADVNKRRGILTHFSTKAREKFRTNRETLERDITKLKAESGKLDQASILATLTQIEGIRSELKGNAAFEVLKTAFLASATRKFNAASGKGDDATLSKDRLVIERVHENNFFLDDSEFSSYERNLSRYTKNKLEAETDSLVKNKEAGTLGAFEKGIDKMKSKGLSLGLTEEECNAQIVNTLKNKIRELEKNTDSQSRIKIILVNRLIANLE